MWFFFVTLYGFLGQRKGSHIFKFTKTVVPPVVFEVKHLHECEFTDLPEMFHYCSEEVLVLFGGHLKSKVGPLDWQGHSFFSFFFLF